MDYRPDQIGLQVEVPAVAGHALEPHAAGMLVIREVGDVDEAGALEDLVWRPEHPARMVHHQVGRPLLRLRLGPAGHT